MNDLDARLIKAHEKGDRPALVALYQEAAQAAPTKDAAAFYMTHAYVFALEAGLDIAPALRDWLIDAGRETPDV